MRLTGAAGAAQCGRESMADRTAFTERVVRIIRAIPRGRVASYGQIAALAGFPAASRQVVRILHSLSAKEVLPWHRVINSRGTISLTGRDYELQRVLLEREGIEFGLHDRIDLGRFQWRPRL
jgi:methylated-DNA-protein-cysteine methyltransferase-like protein